jgi:hypothetical protein
MKFWDSSAIVPLCVEETATDRALALANQDPERRPPALEVVTLDDRLRQAALKEGFRVPEM